MSTLSARSPLALLAMLHGALVAFFVVGTLSDSLSTPLRVVCAAFALFSAWRVAAITIEVWRRSQRLRKA